MRLVRPGKWELRVSLGRWDNGRPRSFTRQVSARGKAAAAAALAEFVDEMSNTSLPRSQETRDLTVDEAMERFLTEYLAEEKGRAEKTISDYRNLHRAGSPPPSDPKRSSWSTARRSTTSSGPCARPG